LTALKIYTPLIIQSDIVQHNRIDAFLKNLEDDSHVKTRVSQYQALENGKGIEIAKEIVKAKIEGQNRVLKNMV
jgi:CRISPR/Cas system-associated endonuclease Cas1